VFFYGSGGVYHVAIYAGHGYIWEAPKPGGHVHKVKIWSKSVRYGRY
jgi:cell wall-associated NlpC family hydrolase